MPDETHSGYEGGIAVPTVEPETHDNGFDVIDDRLDSELEEIVTRRVNQEVAHAIWEAVSRFAVEIKAHKNPLLTLDAFCFAAGSFILDGTSITELAAKHNVTKQALSKRVVQITEALGLGPSRGMKSKQARESYRKAHTKHETRIPVGSPN